MHWFPAVCFRNPNLWLGSSDIRNESIEHRENYVSKLVEGPDALQPTIMHYSFPILERKEIVSYLLDAGISLEEQHLVKPSIEAVWPLYENLVLNLMGITSVLITAVDREELQQPAFHTMGNLEYPELHEESVGNLASIRAIVKLMAVTGVSDFSMMDIFKPESKRTINNLSAIINFSKYKQEKENQLAELLDEREQAFLQFQHSEERLTALNAEIEAMETDRRAQQPAVQALEVETKDLEHEIQALNKQHGALQSEIRALKQEGNTVVEEVQAEKYLLLQARGEQERLKSQIVQSPQKLQRALAERKATLQEIEASAEEVQQSLNHWKDKLEAYNKVEKKLKKFLVMLDELEKLWIKQKATVKERKALKAKVKAIEEEIESLDTELSQLKFQEQHWIDLTEKLEYQRPRKIQEAKRELEETKARCLPLLAQLEERGASIMKTEGQVKEIREKLEAIHRKKDATIARGTAAVQKVMTETLEHYSALLRATGTVPIVTLPRS